MIIFLQNIPLDINQDRLCQYITENVALVHGFRPFLPKIQIEGCEILEIEDGENSKIEHHGLIYIEEKNLYKTAIKRLQGMRLGERQIEPRLYKERSTVRDRRTLDGDQAKMAIIDRRHTDRRRPNLTCDIIH
ncbi:MAG: hypothetical protein GY696_18540 [Gammaproteobacteria bacterium]|nr:hypothetical protein [Gammaproteobacteria bacterium]